MKFFFAFFISSCLLSTAPCLAQTNDKPSFSMERKEGNGLRAEYFNGSNFQEKVLSRIDEEINFSYLYESPAQVVNTENYSIRWTGSLYAPVTGTYKVIVRVDDGVRLWVNDVKLIDKWQLQQTAIYYNYIALEGGEFYKLKIEYFNEPLHATMQLMWESPEDKTSSFFGLIENTPRKIIPKQYLYGDLPEEEPEQEHTKPQAEEAAPPVAGKKKKNSRPDMAEKIAEVSLPEIDTEEEEEDIFENLKPGAVVSFKNVLFEQGKYILLEGSYTELDKLLRTMIRYPALKIRIDGHTDNVGDPNLNQSLSFFRAKVVETYLVEHGIDVSRIEVKGYGSSRPLADNSTEEGRAKNRRVEFVIK